MHGRVLIDIVGNDSALRRSLGRTLSTLRSFARRATQVFVGVGLVILARKFFSLANAISDAYKSQIASEAKLAAVINSTGQAAGFSLAQFKDLATIYQELTAVGDDVILNMFAVLSTFKNVRGDEFKTASKAILDMSVVLDTDLKGAAIQVGKALNDPVKGIAALSRVGVSFSVQQKKQIEAFVRANDVVSAQRIILAELNSEFGGSAKKVADASKVYDRYYNRIGDVMERMVAGLAPAFVIVEEALSVFTQTLEGLVGLVEQNEVALTIFGQVLKDKFIAFLPTVAKAIAITISAAMNSVAIAQNAFAVFSLKGQLAFEQLKLTIGWILGGYLVAVFNTSVDNLKTFADGMVVILKNAWDNFSGFLLAIKNRLTGQDDDFQFIALEKGFVKTFKKLPGLFDRPKSLLEESLQLDIGTAQKGLEDSFKGTFDFADSLATKIEGLFNNPRILPEEEYIIAEENDAPRPTSVDPNDSGSGSPGIEGLEDLNSRINDAAAKRRNPVVGAIGKLAEAQKQLPPKIAAANAAQQNKNVAIKVDNEGQRKLASIESTKEDERSRKLLTAVTTLNTTLSELNLGLA